MPSTLRDRIDGLTTSVAVKAPCVAASTTNLALASLQTVGGIDVEDGDRVLVKDQTDATENGIYVAYSTAWERAKDFDGARDAVPGTLVLVRNSSSDIIYKTVSGDSPVIIGTSTITFELAAFGDASTISFLQAGSGAIARSFLSKGRDVVNLADFGVVGDGVTNDTVQFQAALDSGARLIEGIGGQTYLVSQRGTKTFSGSVERYCLLLPPGVTLDLKGATIKLANGQNAAILMNKNAGTTQDADVVVRRVTLDGNEANQTTPGTGGMPCIFLYDCLRARVENLKVQNARQYFGRFLKCDQSYFNDLNGKRSDGDGWSFGVSGVSNLTNSFIDNVYAEDCTSLTYGTQQGNPALFTMDKCVVGKCEGVNCGGGFKIQGPASDNLFQTLIYRGGANVTANSGVKLQGQTGLRDLVRVHVGQILAEGCHSEGLYIFETKDCSVGQYSGYGNAANAAGTLRDVYTDESERLHIRAIIVDTPSASATGIGVIIGPETEDYQIGSISIYNPRGRGVQIGALHYGTIESTVVVDDQGSPTLTQGFVITTSAAKGKLGAYRDNLAPSTSQGLRCLASVINLNYEVGKIMNGSSDALEGVVTLTNAATSTTVACGHIAKAYVGTSTTDHYFHPIIQLSPWNATAMALEASGGFRSTVVRDTTGTGFDIKHSAAGATDYVAWKVVGWKVVQREAA